MRKSGVTEASECPAPNSSLKSYEGVDVFKPRCLYDSHPFSTLWSVSSCCPKEVVTMDKIDSNVIITKKYGFFYFCSQETYIVGKGDTLEKAYDSFLAEKDRLLTLRNESGLGKELFGEWVVKTYTVVFIAFFVVSLPLGVAAGTVFEKLLSNVVYADKINLFSKFSKKLDELPPESREKLRAFVTSWKNATELPSPER
ncbi:MAG: hypothetical protein HW380_2658 [Magnetococcales bacterium]|nr:hypothetical protein [Magnetococcales bacterium]